MDRERRAARGEVFERLARGHRGCAARGACEHDGLCDFGQSQLLFECGSGRGERGHAGRNREGNPVAAKAPELFAERAPNGEVTGVQARDVEAAGVCIDELFFDLLEVEGRGVEDARAGWSEGDDFAGDERPGVEANGAASYEIAAAYGDEIRSAWSGADEVNSHEAP